MQMINTKPRKVTERFNRLHDAKVQKARAVPIKSIYPGELKQTGVALIGLCPFHDDHKPSFVLYPKTNSWYCFAEGRGGDVISLLQKLYNLKFSEAIERLIL